MSFKEIMEAEVITLISLFGVLLTFFVIIVFWAVKTIKNFDKTIDSFQNNVNDRFLKTEKKIDVFTELFKNKMEEFQKDTLQKVERQTNLILREWTLNRQTIINQNLQKQANFFENQFINMQKQFDDQQKYLNILTNNVEWLKKNKKDKTSP